MKAPLKLTETEVGGMGRTLEDEDLGRTSDSPATPDAWGRRQRDPTWQRKRPTCRAPETRKPAGGGLSIVAVGIFRDRRYSGFFAT